MICLPPSPRGPPGTPRQGAGGRVAAGAPALAGHRVRPSWSPARLQGRGWVSKAGLPAHLEGIPPEQPLIPRSASRSAPRHPRPCPGHRNTAAAWPPANTSNRRLCPAIRRGKILDLSSLWPHHPPGPGPARLCRAPGPREGRSRGNSGCPAAGQGVRPYR